MIQPLALSLLSVELPRGLSWSNLYRIFWKSNLVKLNDKLGDETIVSFSQLPGRPCHIFVDNTTCHDQHEIYNIHVSYEKNSHLIMMFSRMECSVHMPRGVSVFLYHVSFLSFTHQEYTSLLLLREIDLMYKYL